MKRMIFGNEMSEGHVNLNVLGLSLYYARSRKQVSVNKRIVHMNPYESNTTGPLVNSAPLFASVWLALFYVLKKNFNERRSAVSAEAENLSRMKEK